MARLGTMVGGVLAAMMLAVGPAHAGLGGAIAPTFPGQPVNVGDTLPNGTNPLLNVTITNGSTGAQAAEFVEVFGILLTPSCGAQDADGTCQAVNEDPGVYQVGATAVGHSTSSCEAVAFTVSVADAATGRLSFAPTNNTTLSAAITTVGQTSISVASNTGFVQNASISFLIQIDAEYLLVTAGQASTTWTVTRGVNGTTAATHASGAAVRNVVTLGPASGGLKICVIDFTATVKKVPTIDVDPVTAGTQTFSLSGAQLRDTPDGIAQPTDGSAQSTVTGPSLTINKTPKAPGPIVGAGSAATFTIAVTNNGDGAATNVLLTDTLQGGGLVWSGPTPAVADCAITGATNSQVLNCTTLAVPIGGTVNIIISAQTTAQACPTAIQNTSSITGFNGNVATGLASSAQIQCQQISADLFLTKTDAKTTVNPNSSTTYTMVVTNLGPSAATNAIFKDPAAAGLSKVSAACTGTTGGAVCPATTTPALLEGAGVLIPTFPANSTVTFTVTATVTAIEGSVTNVATITPPAGTTNPGTGCTVTAAPNARSFDAATGTCTANDTDTVNLVVNLFVSKTDGTTTLPLGSSTTYTVTVTNSGPSGVAGATVTDPAPAGLTIGAWSCSVTNPGAGSSVTTQCGLASGTGAISTTADLKPGGVVQYVVQATLTALSGSVTNSASVAPPGGTTNTGTGCTAQAAPNARVFNNPTCTASDTDNVLLFTFSISKVASTGQATSGQSIFFTMVITNNGPSAADGATLNDPAIGGFNATGVTCTNASGGATCPTPADDLASLQNGTATIGTFPSGGSVTLQLDGTFNVLQGSATNTATVCPSANEPTVSCVSASATVSVPNNELPIPTLSEYALIALMLMMAGLGVVTVRRRRR